MTVCNSCRYCEAYCPVFPAMENRTAFAKGDILYLANLCHNCGECLYACQYAPPHEFGINVPRVFAEARLGSYEEYCWPSFMRGTFRRSGVMVSLAVSLASMALVWMFVQSADARDDFYAVIPHDIMVGIFGLVGLFVVGALAIGYRRAGRSFGAPEGGHYRKSPTHASVVSTFRWTAFSDVLTLRHLHATGDD